MFLAADTPSSLPWPAAVLLAIIAASPGLVASLALLKRQTTMQDSQKRIEGNTAHTAHQVTPSNGETTAYLVEKVDKRVASLEHNQHRKFDDLSLEQREMRRDVYGLGVALGNHIWGHDPAVSDPDRRRWDFGHDPERRQP